MLIDKRKFAVATGGFCAFTNLYPVQALLPELTSALNMTAAEGGLVFAAGIFAVALTAPFAGSISDMFGRKNIILGSLLALAIITLLTAQASSFESLLALRFLAGLCIPGIFTTVIAYIGEEWDARESVETMGIYVAGTIAGGFCGRFIAGLVTHQWNWQAAFITLGLLDFLLAGLMYCWLPRSSNFQPSGGLAVSLRAMSAHVRNPQLLLTCAIGFGLLFILVAIFTYVSLRLALPPYGFGPAAVASVFTVYLLAVVGTPVAGRALARFGRGNVAACATPAGIIGMLITLAPGLDFIIAGLSIATLSIFVLQTTATGFLSQVSKRGVSAAVGLYTTSYYLGGSLGAIAPSPFWTAFGWPACVALVIAVQAAILGISLKLWPVSHKATGIPYKPK